MTHSPCSPSSLERRAACPGSYWLEKDFPEPETTTVDIESGIRCHKFLAQKKPLDLNDNAGFSEDEQSAILTCEQYLKTIQFESMETEVSIDLSFIHKDIGHGTADIVAFNKDIAHVIDWKFGHISPPPASKNMQLAAYACGVLRQHPTITGVKVHLVMARQNEFSFEHYPKQRLEQNVVPWIRAIAEYASAPWSPLVPDRETCRYCKATLTCPALMSRVKDDPGWEAARSLSPSELSKIYSHLEPLKVAIKTIEGLMYKIIIAGGTIPGYSLQPGRSIRAWAESVTLDTLVADAMALGKSIDVTEQTLKSPAQIEKLWGKSKAVVERLAEKIVSKPGALSLKKGVADEY